MRRSLFAIALPMFFGFSTFASHLCGADILYNSLGGLAYRIEARLYLNSNASPDAPYLLLSYGDGAVDTLAAQSEQMFGGSCCDLQRSYAGEHVYAAPGAYAPSASLPNRNAGIINIPGSVDVPLCIGATLIVTLELDNASPVFGNPATSSYFVGSTLTHELQPYDADGDSLTFELVPPLGIDCSPIQNYLFPDEVPTGPDNQAWLDDNGVFHWDAPQWQGFYTIAIQCSEWRAGQLIGSVTRDMMLCVPFTFTAVPEADAPAFTISQDASTGEVRIVPRDTAGCAVSVMDARGSLVRRLRIVGTGQILATDRLAPGVYAVTVADADGLTGTGRFTIFR